MPNQSKLLIKSFHMPRGQRNTQNDPKVSLAKNLSSWPPSPFPQPAFSDRSLQATGLGTALHSLSRRAVIHLQGLILAIGEGIPAVATACSPTGPLQTVVPMAVALVEAPVPPLAPMCPRRKML